MAGRSSDVEKKWKTATRVIHTATDSRGTVGPGGGAPVAQPIWQSSTFEFQDPTDVSDAATAYHPETFYTRYGNPNFTTCENALVELEGGEAALVTGSGMGAIMLVFLGSLRAGDHIVAQRTHYVGTMKALASVLPRYGIEITLVDQTDLDAFEKSIQPNTRLIYIETPTNPTLTLTDIAAVAELARGRGVTSCIDNTFATPVNQKPLELGIDLVVHSATKYMGGHSDVTAGAVVGDAERIAELWHALIVHGMILHPFEAWLLARGLQTLPFRVERQNGSALALAEFLAERPEVDRVYYPGLAGHPQHELATRQMRGFGGMVVFELAGGFDAAKSFIKDLQLARMAVSLGGSETLAVHAASMIHARLSAAERAAAGISDNLIRVSVGLEDAEDIVQDFDQALKRQ